MALPDFFIIGAPKAGTTALHVALDRHPQLYMSRLKEPKHFLCDGGPPDHRGPGDARTAQQSVWRREEYEALFQDAPKGALRGESTALYLQDAAAHRRIHDAVPDARLVAVLRDPIDRAHSNWTHMWSAGLEPEADFLRACGLEEQRAGAGWAPFWRYLGLGRYGEQLTRLLEVFPREQVLLLRYLDLRDEPVRTLDRLCRFLGVGTGVLADIPAENVTADRGDSTLRGAASTALRAVSAVEQRLPARWWGWIDRALGRYLQREQRPRRPLTPEQREVLIPRIADDVLVLEELTGEVFDAWFDPHRPGHRVQLRPEGPFGTAHRSIDRPLDQQ